MRLLEKKLHDFERAHLTLQPRRVFMDQMAAILSSDYNSPEVVIMINSQEWHGQVRGFKAL